MSAAGAGSATTHPGAGRSLAASPRSSGASDYGGLGPVIALPPNGGPPPTGGETPPPGAQFPTLENATPGVPVIGVSQPTGDGTTIFIVRGESWPPGQSLTITLVGVLGLRTSPIHPTVDGDGSFNYAINQDHEFFRGALPAGTYTVSVTDRAGVSARARFRVS